MGKEIIRLEGIKKSYGQSEVLKGIDLSVNESEVVVLLGPSGTGKSTLLRCINPVSYTHLNSSPKKICPARS